MTHPDDVATTGHGSAPGRRSPMWRENSWRPVWTALARMLEEDVGHLPVLAGDRLVGMCTRTDILRARRRLLDDEHLQPGWRLASGSTKPINAHPLATDDPARPEREVPMRFCLIAENQSLGGEALHDVINARLATGPCHFHVVVPATDIHDLYQQMLAPYEGEVPDSHVAIAEAQGRLDRALTWLRTTEQKRTARSVMLIRSWPSPMPSAA